MTLADPVHHALDIIADARTRLLILGSLPGQTSLRERRYYANPANQFWRLLSPVIDVDLVGLGYDERLDALRKHGMGLWDVIGSARRFGSLDHAIRDAEVRDLKARIRELPALRAIAFNGATACRIGIRQLGHEPAVDTIALPSSSGAHAIGLAAKQPAWSALRRYLG